MVLIINNIISFILVYNNNILENELNPSHLLFNQRIGLTYLLFFFSLT